MQLERGYSLRFPRSGITMKAWIESLAAYAAQVEMDRLLTVLGGASDIERGEALLNAHVARLRCEETLPAPPELFLDPVAAPAALVSEGRSALENARRSAVRLGQARFAFGVAVWLHSLDAVAYPELRTRGRELWGLLSRGLESAKTRAAELGALGLGVEPGRLIRELAAIPSGFEPTDSIGDEYMPGVPGAVVLRRLLELEAEMAEPTMADLLLRLEALRESLMRARERYGLGASTSHAA
ncbi:MAG: hypothetical protein ACLPN5_22680 [Roseiarcus sp.]